MVSVTGAWAQNLPGGIWSSPQSTATEGRYRSNADDFIRPDTYTGLRLSKWFGLVAFNSKVDAEGAELGALATAGFATKVKKVYIGAFYSGDFWTWSPTKNYTKRQFITAPLGGVAYETYDVYSSYPNVVPRPVNNAALLIGIADMGFRLTYRTDHQSFKENDIVIGNDATGYQLYKSYQTEGGYIAPQIAWAMAKDLTEKNGIRPYATLDLVFYREYQKAETAGADAEDNFGEKITYSENHFDPSLGAGMGGYHFYNKDGFRLTADIDYILTLNIYNNEYSYAEDGNYKTGKIKGTYRVSSQPFTERSYVFNSLTPSLAGSWSKDRLALRFKLNLPLTLTNEKQSIMNLDSSYDLINTGASNTNTVFTFRPDLRLALQYKIFPDRLTLNAGARIQATAITIRTTDNTNYSPSGDIISSSKIHETTFADNTGTGSRFVSRFHLGATFNLTENVWLEAMTGVSNAYGDGVIDIFAPGGLFSFGSILVVLKFNKESPSKEEGTALRR
jgi:hypothetical protein